MTEERICLLFISLLHITFQGSTVTKLLSMVPNPVGLNMDADISFKSLDAYTLSFKQLSHKKDLVILA